MKKRRNKKIQAYVYVILGPIMSLFALRFSFYMYFSSTFLPGKYLSRDILYITMAVLFFIGLFIYDEGERYLKKIRRKRK